MESAKLLQRMRQVLSQCTVLCRSVGPWHSCDPSGRTSACEPARPSSACLASAVHPASKWPLGGKNVATVRLRPRPARITFWPRSTLAVLLGPLGMREEGPALTLPPRLGSTAMFSASFVRLKGESPSSTRSVRVAGSPAGAYRPVLHGRCGEPAAFLPRWAPRGQPLGINYSAWFSGFLWGSAGLGCGPIP